MAISCVVYMGLRVLAALKYAVGTPKPYGCVTLYYHGVPSRETHLFARQMDTVSRLTTPISLQSWSESEANVRYAAITFDDGLESVANNAIPELVKRNIPATVFITTGALGDYPTWWPEGSPERGDKVMSPEQVRGLPKNLITVGSHTLSHPMLPQISKSRAVYELRESKAELQRIIERDVNLFSFPFGAFTHELIEVCWEAGYKRVFTSVHSTSFTMADEVVSGRVKVEPSDWEWEFKLKLLGAYSWLPYASRWKRLMFGRFRRHSLRAVDA